VMRVVGSTAGPARVRLDRDEIVAPTIVFEQENDNLNTDGPGSLLYHSGAGSAAVPVRISWQTEMTYDNEAGVAHFQDGVQTNRQETSLRSDRLDLFFARPAGAGGLATSPRVTRALAQGQVSVTQTPVEGGPTTHGAGRTMTWDVETGTIVLTGEPARFWQGQNVIRCAQVTLRDQERQVTGDGAGRLVVYNQGVDTSRPPEGSEWEKVTVNWEEGLSYGTLTREATFRRNVLVREGDRTLFSRRLLTASFTQDEAIRLREAIAEGQQIGDVTVTQEGFTGEGTWFRWDAISDVVELQGKPYALLRAGANEVRGQEFRFDKELPGRADHLRVRKTSFIDFLEQ